MTSYRIFHRYFGAGLLFIASFCVSSKSSSLVSTTDNSIKLLAASQNSSADQSCGVCIHGYCSGAACICNRGWSGLNCSQLSDCSAVGGCGEHGVCTFGGVCECDLRWSGSNCSIGSCPQNCSSHGQCDAASAECLCDPQWGGRACQRRLCATNCSDRGQCIDGYCVCDEGYRDPRKAPEVEDCDSCKNLCSNHGDCDPVSRQCVCNPWFTGEDCSTEVCPAGCSGHGSCIGGVCVCDAGWASFDCVEKLCPNSCSGHGSCVAGMCICQTGYVGFACEGLQTCSAGLGPTCSGHGACDINVANGTCTCEAGWSGRLCEKFDSILSLPSCVNNCSEHGSCLQIKDGSFACSCDAGWSGNDCSEVALPTSSQTPSPVSQSCAIVNGSVCSGHGQCMGAACICDVGFGNDDCSVLDMVCSINQSGGSNASVCGVVGCPSNCSGVGTCQAGGVCACDFGYFGSACEQRVVTVYSEASSGVMCSNNCSYHGVCVNGTCQCSALWTGNDCSLLVMDGWLCPGNCSSRGVCTANNTCHCDPGWLGSTCNVRAQDAFDRCAFNCSGRGACVNGSQCWCDAGWTGLWCEQRVLLVLGHTAAPSQPVNSIRRGNTTCPRDCLGRGLCVDGKCHCSALFAGEDCGSFQLIVSGGMFTCLNDCNSQGACVNGMCVCDAGFDGIDCSIVRFSSCAGNCSEQGVCTNGTCACDRGWTGLDCSLPECPGGCSSRGFCGPNGTCICDVGWTGDHCDTMDCPRGCGGHGTCGIDLRCVCDSGWIGDDCMTPTCPNNCNNHGACTANGTCICYSNWGGIDCSTSLDCSMHGQRICGFCKCNSGFYGNVCERDYCADSRFYGDLDRRTQVSVCSNNGKCSEYGCICDAGFTGRNCSLPSSCPSMCSGHGTCAGGPGRCAGAQNCPDVCTCIRTATYVWTGATCNVQQCPGNFLLSGSVFKSCSGQGDCIRNAYTGLPQCSCVIDGATNNPLTDVDCGAPSTSNTSNGLPKFAITDISPDVGPISGGTVMTLQGLGMDRLLTRFSFIDSQQVAKGSIAPAFYCVLELCSPTNPYDCRNLSQSPITWETTVAVEYSERTVGAPLPNGVLSLRVGDSVTVYGCNPCAEVDTAGVFQQGMLVGKVGDKIGYITADLHSYLGESRDRVYCTAPPALFMGQARFYVTGRARPNTRTPYVTGNFVMDNTATTYLFQYYEEERLVRVDPDYAPLRFMGGVRGPSDIDKPVVVTVTGVYFLPTGAFSCMFYDESTTDTQCRSPATRIDDGTLTCVMPAMRRAKELKLRISSNSVQFSSSFVVFRVYEVDSIDPVCSPWVRSAVVTVFGVNLIRSTAGQSKQAVCRFGRVSATTGATSNAELTVRFAFHSIATPSETSEGALECPAPPVYLELNDFALTLDGCECGKYGCATCLFSWTPPIGGQNYFLGLWDAARGSLHTNSGLPAVFFVTVPLPTVTSIHPTLGPLSGITLVTVRGINFATDQCPWGLNQHPACSFGFIRTSLVTNIDHSAVVCTSPPSVDVLETKVPVEVGIDGQSFTGDGVIFLYILPFGTMTIKPSIGDIGGGSPVQVLGPSDTQVNSFSSQLSTLERLNRPVENLQLGLFKNTETLACVFIPYSGGMSSLVTPATFLSNKLVRCFTPTMPAELEAGLYISPNNETDSSQLSYGNTPFTYFSNPTLNRLMDQYGPVAGGTVVTVLGQGFRSTRTLRCRFYRTVVPATFVSANSLTCKLPAGSPGRVSLQVSLNGQEYAPSALSLVYFTGLSITPSQGPLAGGNSVRIVVDTAGQLALSPDLSFFLRLGGLGAVPGVPSAGEPDTVVFANLPKGAAAGTVTVDLSVQSASLAAGSNFGAMSFDYEYYTLSVVGVDPLPLAYTSLPVDLPLDITIEASSLLPVVCRRVKMMATGPGTADVVSGTYAADGAPIVSCPIPPVPLNQLSTVVGWTVYISFNGVDWVLARNFTLSRPVVVLSADPSMGARVGGATLTVTGSDFSQTSGLSCHFSLFDGAAIASQAKVSATFVTTTRLLCLTPSSSDQASELLHFALDVSLNGRDPGLQADQAPLGSRMLFSYHSYREPSLFFVSNRTGTNSPVRVNIFGINLGFDGPPAPVPVTLVTSPPFCTASDPLCWQKNVPLNLTSSKSEAWVWVGGLPAGHRVQLGFELSLNGGSLRTPAPQYHTYFDTTPSCAVDLVDCGVGVCGAGDACSCLMATSGSGAWAYSFGMNPLLDVLQSSEPSKSSPFSAGLACDGGPQILKVRPNSGLMSGGTLVYLATGYFGGRADCGIWCRLAPYQIACSFTYTYFDGSWRSVVSLANVSKATAAGWVPWQAISPPTNQDLTANDDLTPSTQQMVDCSLPAQDARYRCLVCRAPPNNLNNNPNVRNISVAINLAVVTANFQACASGMGSCAADGTPIRMRRDADAATASLGPMLAGFSSVAPREYTYYSPPNLTRVSPLAAPVRTAVDLEVDLQVLDAELSLRQIFLDGLAACRLDWCPAVGCSTPGPACRCPPEQALTPGAMWAQLVYTSEATLVCRLANDTVVAPGLYVVSVSLNGQDWVSAPRRHAVLFYTPLEFVYRDLGGRRLSFGVAPLLTAQAAGDYPRAAPSEGGTPLVGYFGLRVCPNRSREDDVDCAMVLNASCDAGDLCEGRVAQPTLRLVPGRCASAGGCACAGSGSRDAAMLYEGAAEGFYGKLSARVPEVSAWPDARLGVHHVCFSLDASYYYPMVLATDGSRPPEHLFLFDAAVTGLSVSEGPNSGQLKVTMLGRGFPARADLREFSSDPNVQVHLLGGFYADGTAAVVRGFDQCEDPSRALGACSGAAAPKVDLLSASEIRVSIPYLTFPGSPSVGAVQLALSLNGVDLTPEGPSTLFSSFAVPILLGWLPLHGFFEEDLNMTIYGSNFTNLGTAFCRFPTLTCYDEEGTELKPCLRPATYISSSQMQCTLPGISRNDEQGQLVGSAVTLQFSPYATDRLLQSNPEMYQNLFVTFEEQFTFHLPLDKAKLDLHASPLHLEGMQHRLLLDTTDQMIRKQAGGPLECLPLAPIFDRGALRLSLRNVGSTVANTLTQVTLTSVVDTLHGCSQLQGFCCTTLSTNVTCCPNPNDRKPSCCSAAGMDPATCCPLAPAPGQRVQCLRPNIIAIDPTIAVGDLQEVCNTVVLWSPPVIRFCRLGLLDGEPCVTNGDCLGGVCQETPMLADLRLSTNGGQQYSAAPGTQVLFYSRTELQDVFPTRLLKDCGESSPGARDCGWGTADKRNVARADQTLCGKVAVCEERENLVLTLHCPMDLAQLCTTCRPITSSEAATPFLNASCRFTARYGSSSDNWVSVVVAGVYTFGLDFPMVSCPSPVFTDPFLVDVEVALDGRTFVGRAAGSSVGQVLFITRPSVSSALPTNGVFQAETDFTVRGQDFCNGTAGLRCNVPNGTTDWCIFDFQDITPASDRWTVARKYTPARVVGPNQLYCKAPSFLPDTVPARPRARVGVMLNLRFDASGLPLNIERRFYSTAFVIFHPRPVILRLMPSTGPSSLTSSLQVQAQGVFNTFPGCNQVDAITGAVSQIDLTLGNDPSGTCSSPLLPPALLYCRFGDAFVPASLSSRTPASTPASQLLNVACDSPVGASLSQRAVPVSVGLSGMVGEFSLSLTFLYTDVVVVDTVPRFGVDVAGDMLLIAGANFRNITQLSCFFEPLSDTLLGGGVVSTTLKRKAIFVDTETVLCPLPAAYEYPLSCTCRCSPTPCSDNLVSSDLASYDVDGAPTYTKRSVIASVCSCCNPWPASLINASCGVTVTVGANLERATRMPAPAVFQYYSLSPQVATMVPSSGPVSGITSITLTGTNFPFPTNQAVAEASRCVFGYGSRMLYTPLRILSPTAMTCQAPQLCDWVSDGLTGRTALSQPVAPAGTPCFFPFQYQGRVYTQCQAAVSLPGFLQTSNISAAEVGKLNVTGVTLCSLVANLTAQRSWAVCSCRVLPAMKASFAFTFNAYHLRSPMSTASSFAFYYDMLLNDINPKSGTVQGGTRVTFNGTRFVNIGQPLQCVVGDLQNSPTISAATIINENTVSCIVPAKPTPVSSNVFVWLTGNGQQNSNELPYLYLGVVSLMGVSKTLDTDALRNSTDNQTVVALGFAPGGLVKSFRAPSGTVDGGDLVVVTGNGFVENSRCPVAIAQAASGQAYGSMRLAIGGNPQSCLTVAANNDRSFRTTSKLVYDSSSFINIPSAVDSTCPSQIQCQLPFYYRKANTPSPALYTGCTSDDVKLRFPSAADDDSWCPVNFLNPLAQTFTTTVTDTTQTDGFMLCNCKNSSVLRLRGLTCGYASGVPGCPVDGPAMGLLYEAARVQCRFGNTVVDSTVLTTTVGQQRISCKSPPAKYGVRMPISVTLNRVDQTSLSDYSACLVDDPSSFCTFFQYLEPAPKPVAAYITKTFGEMYLVFDKPTDMAGMAVREIPNTADSGCLRLLADVSAFQPRAPSQTLAKCRWSPDGTALILAIADPPTFTAGMPVKMRDDQTVVIRVQPRPRLVVPLTLNATQTFDKNGDGVASSEELIAQGIYDDTMLANFIKKDPTILSLSERVSYGVNATVSLPLQLPPPSTPTAVLLVPTAIDTCTTSLTLDALASTGSDGRSFVSEDWTVTGPQSASASYTTALAVLRRMLQNQYVFAPSFLVPKTMLSRTVYMGGNSSFCCASGSTICSATDTTCTLSLKAADLIPPGSTLAVFTIKLNLTNWGGAWGAASTTLEVRQQAVPQVWVLGGSQQRVAASGPLVLVGQMRGSACVEQFVAAANWTAICSSPALQQAWATASLPKDRLKLFIPARTLQLHLDPNPSCLFTLTMTQSSNSINPPTAAFNVTVRFTPSLPRPIIDQGDTFVSSGRDLLLSARLSADPDLPPARANATLWYCWSCSSPDCANWTGWPTAGVAVTVSRALLRPSASYTITLLVVKVRAWDSAAIPLLAGGTCPKGGGWLNASTTVRVDVAPAGVDPPVARIAPLTVARLGASDVLRLEGVVAASARAGDSSRVFFRWTILPSPPELLQYNRTLLEGLSAGPVSLVISPGLFEGNQVYTVRLSSITNLLSANSQVQLLINKPPESGVLSILPASISSALKEKFTISVTSWNDDDMPIRVQFGFRDYTTGSVVLLNTPCQDMSIITSLPQGDPAASNELKVFANVLDAQGASQRIFCGGTWPCPVISPYNRDCRSLRDTFIQEMKVQATGDTPAVMAVDAVFGLVLKSLALTLPCDLSGSWASVIAEIRQGLFDRMAPAAGGVDAESRDQKAGALLAIMPPTKDMTSLMLTQSMAAVQQMLSGGGDALSDETNQAMGKLLGSLTSAFIALSGSGRRALMQDSAVNAQNIFDFYTQLAVAGMRGRSPGEELVSPVNQSAVYLAKRFSLSPDGPLSQTVRFYYYCLALSPSGSSCTSYHPSRYVDIPPALRDSLAASYPGLSSFDLLVMVFSGNPLAFAGDGSTTYGDVVRLQVLQGLGPSDAPANPVMTFADLAQELQIQIFVSSAPPPNLDPLTGLYTAVGCGSWPDMPADGTSATAWTIRGGLRTVASFTQTANPQKLASLPAPGYIICSLTAQSGSESLAGVRRTAGCDGSVDVPPSSAKVYNRCLVCQDAVLPMTGICGWDKVPCVAPNRLDGCGVCNGANQSYRGSPTGGLNLTAHLESRAASGICNYAGYRCGCTAGGLPVKVPLASGVQGRMTCVPATVGVCGLCILLDAAWNQVLPGQPSLTVTTKNTGICDCSGNGVPNGGAVLDRCGICNGHNASMDYCGVSPSIPASAVCHTGATAATGSPTWNKSCTGCDLVPRPDLPWFDAPQVINNGLGIGGVRPDVCGVCGGDSSSCAGCDGVPGSAVRLDACGLCGGDGSSCLGCDGVSRARPLLADACGVCNGTNFGACLCNYTQNTNRSACGVGCDGLVGSGKKIDACGVCGGDGSTCAGCDRVAWSGKVWDACGYCALPSLACRGCDGMANSFQRFDCRGVCNGGGLECGITECPAGTDLDECGSCAAPGRANRSCGGCDGVPYSMTLVDVCGVCGGDGRSCLSRLHLQMAPMGCGGGMVFDVCGVCDGPGPNASTGLCADSSRHLVNGVVRVAGFATITAFQAAAHIFRAALEDAAGAAAVSAQRVVVTQVCGPSGAGDACSQGILTRPQPPAGAVDVSFQVVVGDLGAAAQRAKAALRRRSFLATVGAYFGQNLYPDVRVQWLLPACYGTDACGVLCGDGRSCLTCGLCGRGPSGLCISADACGQCGGDGTSCLGCDGLAFSGRTLDECGVCGGDGTSCKGCDGVAHSGTAEDRCRVCGGGNRRVDACGCCPVDTPLCYLSPSSALCPPLCADNSTCMGCDGLLNSGRAVDACGECGGTNKCKFLSRQVTIGERRGFAGPPAADAAAMPSALEAGEEWAQMPGDAGEASGAWRRLVPVWAWLMAVAVCLLASRGSAA